ncbi:hypothetical protein ABW20_dc0107635 [Dactylellina cionopaga]|nr:hypothetical protein ABW20_dc0107635 [Dactylellina cionopaga]
MEYKHRVPVRGGILMNAKMDKVVLVKGWKAGASWAFPRGKINKDEADHICAVREVLEETGYDASELVDPSAFLVDTSEENMDRHLQLYLIKNVPEEFKFYPLARKEISEVAWFSITELQAQSSAHRRRREQTRINAKSGAEDSERGSGNKLRVYKVYGFLPGLTRWIKEQRRAMRQQAKNRKHGGVAYETEPESSAFETSPPRQHRAREERVTPKTATPHIPSSKPTASEQLQASVGSSDVQINDSTLSAASAKLREMIGIGTVPTSEQPQNPQFDKVNAGQSLLAQLQASTVATPQKEPVPTPITTGVSIPVSALFSASKQESQQMPQTPAQQIFGPSSNMTSPNNNFNPSVRRPPQNGNRNGHGKLGQHNTQHQASKQPVMILQRGQPLPDKILRTQPQMDAPVVTQQPPLPPLTVPPHPAAAVQNDVSSPAIPAEKQHSLPPVTVPPQQSQQDLQADVSSPNKMARRPLLTIDAFTPPQPSQPISQEHKGNLLDILRGAKPPPPAQPAMQLQPDESTAPKPTAQSLGDILAGQGVKLPQPTTSVTNEMPHTEAKAPTNGVQPKAADPDHLATLMRSLGNYIPKKVTPPGTVNAAKFTAPAQKPENQPVQPSKPSQPVQPAKALQNLMSPVSPTQNGFTGSPTTVSSPNIPRVVPGADKIPSFDRRATIKPEQAQTLLGLFKSPVAEDTISSAPLPVNLPQNPAPKSMPPKEKTEKVVAPEMNRAGSVSMIAPEMNRTGSLSVEQTAFLMNFLDNLATQHGV